MAHPLPSEYRFGKVVGRAVHAIADTAADEDHLPEARPAVGRVRFTPKTSIRKAVHDYSAFVLKSTVHANLDELGRIIDAEGRLGIWLVTGLYTVSWEVDGSIPPFEIEVTDAHTDESPLDLVTAAPPQPGPGITVQTVIIPAGAAPGQVLGWTPDGLGWVDPEVAGDVSPEVIEARDTAVSAAQSAQGSATAAAQSAVDAGNDRVLAQQAAADALAISVQPPEKGDPGEPGPPGEIGPPGPKGDPGAPGALADSSSYIITGPGRPDVPATTGGIITGSEPVGAEFRSVDGAGVGAWVWMKRPSGWVVTDGDTGWRDVTSESEQEFNSGSYLRVRRINDEVHFHLFGRYVTPSPTAGHEVWVIPAGFRRLYITWNDFGPTQILYNAHDTSRSGVLWLITANGQYRIHYANTHSSNFAGNLTWLTREAWPTALPGTAAT